MKINPISNPSITVLIETANEQAHIEDSIRSAHLLTQDIVVVDMESADKTVALAKKMGAVVYSFPPSYYVEPSRQFGIEKSEGKWILILDADERVTEESAKEILGAVTSTEFTHYKIPRKNIFGIKKWLSHGGWWPDYQVRLINKNEFIKWPIRIHSTPEIKGKMGFLKQPILHYSHGNFEAMVQKTAVFEDIESDLLYKAGRQAGTLIFFRKFIGEMVRRLIVQKGFMDGKAGIMESIYQAYSKTVTYLYLYEKKKSSTL